MSRAYSISPEGRWKGAITSRPLPEVDPSIDTLVDDARAELVEIWRDRAASELRVAESFRVIASDLRTLAADIALIRLGDRGVDDEFRHTELCLAVASRIAGRTVDGPEPLTHAVPQHPGARDSLLPALHVIGHCVLNETFASAFLESTLHVATGAVTRAATRELLSDEVDHARIGWAFLATLSENERQELQPWLLELTHANLRMWRETPRAYPTNPRVTEQGAPSLETVTEALRAALTDLIIPGFEERGFDVRELRSWVESGAQT